MAAKKTKSAPTADLAALHEAHSTKCLSPANPATTVVLARVPSASVPGFFYEVRQSRATGHTYCNCPAWRFQKKPATQRTCKHLKALAAGLAGLAPHAEAK